MAAKDSVTNTSLQSSIAFLQIQKNANLKRSTSMNDDVFRIFRQTGRRIALIKKQVERERCTFLKDSYTEKNQLYKELAGIFHSKKATNSQLGTDVLPVAPLQRVKSRVGLAEKAKEAGHCSAHKSPKADLRSINVNVLKRCECCRRRAFRKVEDDDDDDDEFDEDAFQYESQALGDKSSDRTKHKGGVSRKKSRASKSSSDSITKGIKERSTSKQKTKLVQFSRYDDIRIPATQRVQAGIWALKKQNGRPREQEKQSKSVHFQANSLPASPSREVKVASETPGLSSIGRPALKSRASIKIASQSNKHDKVRLDSNAWASHLQKLQEKKTNDNSTITGLSKAYCAFKKLLNKMEEENEAEQVQEGELRAESRSELPAISRPVSNVSRSDSRWVPMRRSSDTLSIRLNSWTIGSVEHASMDSFIENSKEEKEEALGLGNGQGEKDGDSRHEVYILGNNSLPDILQNQ